MASVYTIVAFLNGVCTTIATLHGLDDDSGVELAARISGVPEGSEADGIISAAQRHARLRGEYVDVLRDGEHIATVGAEGAV